MAVAAAAPILAGCVSEQTLNQGMGAALTPFYHYPMLASGGYDLVFCSGAFMRKNERAGWHFTEFLTSFITQ